MATMSMKRKINPVTSLLAVALTVSVGVNLSLATKVGAQNYQFEEISSLQNMQNDNVESLSAMIAKVPEQKGLD